MTKEIQDLLAAGNLSLQNRDGARAEQLARRVIFLDPRSHEAYFLLAKSLGLQRKLPETLEPLDRALALQPDEPEYVAAKAQILGNLGRLSTAIPWYRRALELRPSPSLASRLAEALMAEGQASEAAILLEPMLPEIRSDPKLRVLAAQAFTEARRFEEAEPLWASRQDMDLTRARAEIYAGRLELAEDLLRSILSRDPHDHQAYSALASIVRFTERDGDLIAAMESELSLPGVKPPARVDLSYALGKARHDTGDYRAAMTCFDEANRLRFESSPAANAFDPRTWRAYFDKQIRYFTRGRVAALAERGLESGLPLFVVGMIRSGTTLAEQILSNHPSVFAGGETSFWPEHRNEIFDEQAVRFRPDAADRLGREFLEILESRCGPQMSAPARTFAIEKNPSNIFLAAPLHCVYPNAKILNMRRHPVDNLLSIWMTPIKSSQPFLFDRKNLVFAFREYERLVRHLEEILPPNRFATFSYEHLTAKPDEAIPSMLEFLELEPNDACLHPEANSRAVRTPSYFQARQPINTASQARWKLYEPWLGEFAELL